MKLAKGASLSEQSSSLPPANWYPAPERPGELRWWDGTAWSDAYAPIDKQQAKRAAKENEQARKAAAKLAKTEQRLTERASAAAAKQAANQQRDFERSTVAYQKALDLWQQERDAAAQQLELVSNYRGDTAAQGIFLKKDEALFAQFTGVSLIEDRAGQGHFEGRSQGISIPIGTLGGHAVRYHVGQSRGHYVAAAPVPTAIDVGTLFVTNHRVIFQGAKASRECLFAKLLAYQTSPNGAATFSVSNRQKATVIHYGKQIAPIVDERLELAMAHFRGSVPELVTRAQNALEAIEAQRPVAPQRVITV